MALTRDRIEQLVADMEADAKTSQAVKDAVLPWIEQCRTFVNELHSERRRVAILEAELEAGRLGDLAYQDLVRERNEALDRTEQELEEARAMPGDLARPMAVLRRLFGSDLEGNDVIRIDAEEPSGRVPFTVVSGPTGETKRCGVTMATLAKATPPSRARVGPPTETGWYLACVYASEKRVRGRWEYVLFVDAQTPGPNGNGPYALIAGGSVPVRMDGIASWGPQLPAPALYPREGS